MSGTSTLSSFYRGDTKTFTLNFNDANGKPIDITGHELWFTMKQRATDLDSQAALQKKVLFPSGSDSEQGIGSLTLSSDDTGSLTPGIYHYDLQKVIPENPPIVATLLQGSLEVKLDITQSDGS
ncbi:MAG: phage baseplate upper protein [Magnetococcus sp. DMHC-6]